MSQIDAHVSLVKKTVEQYWGSLRHQLLDLFFPSRCIGCGRGGGYLCADCLALVPRVIPPFCTRCGDRIKTGQLCKRCRISPLEIESIRSVAYFKGFIRGGVHRLKYCGHTALAEPLGGLMADYWRQCAARIDVIVPVPLHAGRLRERGYNQAALLAREMARRVGLPVNEETLVRHRATAAQVELSASKRQDNVRNAFACVDERLAEKCVLLIDDVCTTGATLEACAAALYESGARSVQALTLARAL